MSNTTPVHVSVILDRSGSMASIADDIVGGFNTFLEEQRREEGSARVTLVQFDGQDPFEVLIDGLDLQDVVNVDPARYQPRGNTPLFDAVGTMIARVDQQITDRADAAEPIEDQLVVVITDGHENASREFDGGTVAGMIEARKGLGWTFVFLGADASTFTEARRMAFDTGSTLQWDKSADGAKVVFSRVSAETSDYRKGKAELRRRKSSRFFEKPVEEE